MLQKVSQKTPIEVLEEQGFFPRDESDISEPLTCESKPLAATKKNGSGESGLSFWTQVSVLMKREFNHIRRDRKATMIRIFQSILMSSLIGIIFFNVGQASRTSPSNVQSQFGAIVLMSCITMTAPAQTALMAFPTERPIFLREYSTRHYTVVAYFLSRLAMEALICAVQCIIMVSTFEFMGSIRWFRSGADDLFSFPTIVDSGFQLDSISRIVCHFLGGLLCIGHGEHRNRCRFGCCSRIKHQNCCMSIASCTYATVLIHWILHCP